MARALDGLRIVDLGTGAAAALAGMLLGDHGARVVRVVEPGSRIVRDGGFVVWDRGKECVALDFDAAARGEADAVATFRRLVAGADVLIDDLPPASPRQMLLEPACLAAVNPRLVHCSITAYGKQGHWKDDPAIDELVLARMGILAGMPGFRPAPVHVVHPLPSVGAAILAAIGIAAALLARETTGRGRSVETSLLAGALLYGSKVTGERLARHVFQTNPSGSSPFYSLYRCADGGYVQLGCVHEAFIATAAKLMGLDKLIAEPRFDKGRAGQTPADDAEIRGAVARVMASRTVADWSEAFEAADVPFAPARSTDEGLADPQVLHNAMVTTLADPHLGQVTQMGVPMVLGATPGRVSGPRAATLSAAPPADWPAVTDAASGSAPPPPADPDSPPLAGIRILEITNLIAGPTTGRILAELGADVVKLEPPAGDMSRPIGRSYFYSVNFAKRSLCIDTGKAEGRRLVQRIAARSDAMIANLRPHATERMGIGPAINPRLIETHLTGYGWDGPYAKRPGIDPLAQALMGLSRAQGGPDNPPVFPAQLAPTDFTTGALGALGTVLALYVRSRTGVVQRVESNLLSGGIMLSSAWFSRYAGKPERPLADKEQYGLGPFHRLYRLRDGWIYVVAETAAQRQAVLATAEIAATDAAPPVTARHPNETPLARALAAAFAGRDRAATLAALARAGAPAAEVAAGDSEVFLGAPHAQANDMVATRQHPSAGTLRVAWQLIRFGATRPPVGLPTPLLGEHTREVLAEAGFDEATIARLHAEGVVKTGL